MPSLLASRIAGELSVSVATPAVKSSGQLSISSNVISLPVWAANRPIAVTRLASAPRTASLYGSLFMMAATRCSHSRR